MSPLLPLSKVHAPNPRWYRGDFHCHTRHSDGVLTPLELAQLGQTEKLDFFVITDHNTLDAYAGFGENPGLLVIPGTEVTYKGGHFNVFGIEQADDWVAQMDYIPAPRAEDKYPTLSALMERTASLGLLNSINHPLLAPWAWEFPDTELRHLHCLEIWNDPSWPDNRRDNPRAIKLWTRWLNDGWRITAIGGSDFHRPQPPAGQTKPPDRLGSPTTHIYADNLSGQAILAAVRQRRAWVSMAGTQATFRAQINGQTYEIGADAEQASGPIELSATVANCPAPARAQFIRNGDVVAETAVTSAAELRFTDTLDSAQAVWYRFDVYTEDGLMLALTNPIYTGPRRAPTRHTYGEFLSDL